MDALDLLSGDAQAFVEKVWASRVHLHHTDPAQLTGLLSFADVDHLLTSTAIRTPAVRVARDGAVLPASDFTRAGSTIAGQPLTGLVDARRLLDLFEDGATVVLQGLHRYWPPLTRLVAELEVALGHPCQANAYLTPPGSQGFAVHSDSHDVFVFQTHGSKLWEVHPAPDERPDERPDGQQGESPDRPADGPLEVLLEPGLSMYLPTGTPHAARAQDAVSLHVTIGINQLTWRTLVDRAVAEAVRGLDLDGHLPAAHLDRPGVVAEGLAGRLHELAEALREVDPAAVADAQVEAFLQHRVGPLHGSLLDRAELAEIAGDTPLRRRPGRPCVLRVEGEQLHLLLGDRRVSVPVRARAAVEQVRDLGDLVPDDLDLDPASALVLCRRLVREGLLEVRR